MPRIVFVCTGNTCRSPMAEALFKQVLKNYATDQVSNECELRSAGILAGYGYPATQEAIQVMAEKSLDISQHSSQTISPEILQWADLVLTMTECHRDHIFSHYRDQADKVYTLAEFAGVTGEEVLDPFGLGIEAYRQAADQLLELMQKILKKLSK